jgi:hypothetical protein
MDSIEVDITNPAPIEVEISGGAQGPAGTGIPPTANNTLVGNVSGATANPIGLNKASVKTLLGFVEDSDMQAALKSLDVYWRGLWSATGVYQQKDWVVNANGDLFWCKTSVGPSATSPENDSAKWAAKMQGMPLEDSPNGAYGYVKLNDGSLEFRNSDGSPVAETIGLTDLARTSAVTSAIAAAAFIPLATSTANRIPKRSGTTGALTDSGVTIDASNNVTGVGTITAGGHFTFASDNLYDIGENGAKRPRSGYFSGYVFCNNAFIAGNTANSGYAFSSHGRFASSSDGVHTLYNAALTDFGRLQFGGTTSAFPALKRSGTTLAVRLADDSADAPLTAGAGTFSGNLNLPGLLVSGASQLIRGSSPDPYPFTVQNNAGSLRFWASSGVVGISSNGTSDAITLNGLTGNITASGTVKLSTNNLFYQATNNVGTTKDIIGLDNNNTLIVQCLGGAMYFRSDSTMTWNIGGGNVLTLTSAGLLSATGGTPDPAVTFAVLNATTATATLGVRRITDRGSRLAYPDGINWRFLADDAIIT